MLAAEGCRMGLREFMIHFYPTLMTTLASVLGLGKLKLLMDSKVNVVMTFPRFIMGVVLDLV